MKTCPVCHGKVFDDMDTCFGCLHSFAGDEGMREADRPIAPETKRRPKEWTVPQVLEMPEEKLVGGVLEGLSAAKAPEESTAEMPVGKTLEEAPVKEGSLGSFPLPEGYRLVISVERS